jgi:hypothetical protein
LPSSVAVSMMLRSTTHQSLFTSDSVTMGQVVLYFVMAKVPGQLLAGAVPPHPNLSHFSEVEEIERRELFFALVLFGGGGLSGHVLRYGRLVS